jgi:hypothetical protein
LNAERNYLLYIVWNYNDAEDGACPLLLCSAQVGVKSGEFYEPPGMGIAGAPTLKDLTVSTSSHVSVS